MSAFFLRFFLVDFRSESVVPAPLQLRDNHTNATITSIIPSAESASEIISTFDQLDMRSDQQKRINKV
jgi:hypothetical protein